MYKCKECSKAVIVLEGKQIRICDCKKSDGTPSTIIMDMNASAKGISKLKT